MEPERHRQVVADQGSLRRTTAARRIAKEAVPMIHPVAQTHDILGEGPCWAAAEGRLYWFDIKGRRLHWLTPQDGLTGGVGLPMRASAAAARAGGGLLMATERGLAFFDPRSGTVDLVRPMSLPEGFRTNDGKVDPIGRFWWSTMDDDGGKRPGAIFRTDPDLTTTQVLDGVHIPNTITFTADGRTLLLADSQLHTLYAYEAPDLRRRTVFAHVDGDVSPDGSALDAEGFLWNAQWGGARLVRYAPDGSVDRIVELPVSQPSSCAFGGPDLATLYVTSAREGLSEAELQDQPLAGALFAFEPGVAGLRLPDFPG
jgi:sugar lactone lactonase YvrE